MKHNLLHVAAVNLFHWISKIKDVVELFTVLVSPELLCDLKFKSTQPDLPRLGYSCAPYSRRRETLLTA